MRSLERSKCLTVSGGLTAAAECEMAVDAILAAVLGYAGATGMGFDPFYPSIVMGAYTFIVSAYFNQVEQTD